MLTTLPPRIKQTSVFTSKLYARAQHSFTLSFMIFAMLEIPILSTLMNLCQGKIIRWKKKVARIVEHE